MSKTVDAVLADIGGTNTRVALARGSKVLEHSVRRYSNADHAGIGDVLRDYLRREDVAPRAACVAMAGPVRDSAGWLTNLAWENGAELHSVLRGVKLELSLSFLWKRLKFWLVRLSSQNLQNLV